MNYWLLTDTHFNHTEKMIRDCGRPIDYEARLLRTASQIPADDVLIHLGDVAMGKESEWNEAFLKACRAKRKILIRGNHDAKSDSWYLEKGWDFVSEGIQMRKWGKRILLTHIPQKDDGSFDVNVHGHLHNRTHRIIDNLSPKCRLLSMEDTKCQAVNLETFIRDIKASSTSEQEVEGY